jgi:hypothetical protein
MYTKQHEYLNWPVYVAWAMQLLSDRERGVSFFLFQIMLFSNMIECFEMIILNGFTAWFTINITSIQNSKYNTLTIYQVLPQCLSVMAALSSFLEYFVRWPVQ